MKDLGKNSKENKLFENVQKNIVVGGVNGDDEDKITEQVMDRHLSKLVTDDINKTNTICDIAKYMANLKEKHMESELKLDLNKVKHRISYSTNKGNSTETDVESGTDDVNKPTTSNSYINNNKQSSEDDEHSTVVIDKRVDKIFKSDKTTMKEPDVKRTLKPSRQTIQLINSPDRGNRSISPIKIIKIKSPHSSLDGHGKRNSVSLSRDNSRERQTSGRIRRASEGGILMKPQYNINSNEMCSTDTQSMIGILKHSISPKSKSPERKSSLSSRKSLSPGTSFDSKSPDYYRLSPYSSFESRSPEFDRKRSLSAHSNFMPSTQQLHETQYKYYPHGYYYSRSPERKGKQRLSKSLERNTQKDGYYSYHSGLSPERVYQIGVPIRSHSAENGLTRNAIFLSRSNESLARSIEHPTCVECLYQQRKTTQQQQQKARARQSRARKKVPRGAIPNGKMKYQRSRSRSEESCVDCNDFYEIHV